MLTTLSMMVLIGIEVFAVAISGAWALTGLFELGQVIGYVLLLVFCLVAAWLMVQLWRKAMSAEPAP